MGLRETSFRREIWMRRLRLSFVSVTPCVGWIVSEKPPRVRNIESSGNGCQVELPFACQKRRAAAFGFETSRSLADPVTTSLKSKRIALVGSTGLPIDGTEPTTLAPTV